MHFKSWFGWLLALSIFGGIALIHYGENLSHPWMQWVGGAFLLAFVVFVLLLFVNNKGRQE